jgi:branched-chain amino acid transport system substrate-binding protein
MGLEYLTQGSNKVGNDKLEVIVKDDQLKPDRGKSLLEECYGDDKADLAVGTTGSPVALAMLPGGRGAQKAADRRTSGGGQHHRGQVDRYIFRTAAAPIRTRWPAPPPSRKAARVAVGMLGLDTAFGRDGVAAFKQAIASIRPNVKVVAEEYAAGNTADFAPFAERLFNALKDKPGKKVIGFIWAGPHPMAKFVDMKPERFGIELAPGATFSRS